MSRIYGIIVILLIGVIAVIESKDEIRFVSVVFRHGNRAPHSAKGEQYPRDPHLNNSFYPVGFGGLTNDGKKREYKLGQMLRKRYNDFLGEIYIPEDIEARSSNVPRTKMSLLLVLAGLYPPAKIQRWNDDLDWQPIPITYVPANEDSLFFPSLACPKYVEEIERVESSPELAKILEEFRPFMEKLTNITGKPINKVEDMWALYHGLMAEVSMNLTLPNWTKEFFPKGRLLEGAIIEYQILNWNTLFKRLNGGVMLKKMIDDMQAVVNGTGTGARKLNLFSGHELNVSGLLKTLDLYKPHVPEYSSAVIVELIRRDDVHYVKVVRYLGIPPEFEDQEIPDCGELCPLDKFIELMRKVTPSNLEMECKPEVPEISHSRDLL